MLKYNDKNNGQELHFDGVSVEKIAQNIEAGRYKILLNFSITSIARAILYLLTTKFIFLLPIISKVFANYIKKLPKRFFVLKYLHKNNWKTPFYLYSERAFVENYNALKRHLSEAVGGGENLVCFSVKSCSNINVLRVLKNQGSGADVVSGGELLRALKAGICPQKIVFAGVGKTSTEIEFALKCGILQLNAESFEEIAEINQIAAKLALHANVCLRLNPDIDAKTNSKITTGKKDNKFGICIEQAKANLVDVLKTCENINFVGVSTHIGSQITEQKPLEEVFCKLAEAFCHFVKLGYPLKTIDFGGGLGIKYKDGDIILSPQSYAGAIATAMQYIKQNAGISQLPLIIIEPGRFISANAGILVGKITRVKKTQTKNFIITEPAMNDLIRPALYEGYHKMLLVKTNLQTNLQDGANLQNFDVVGPICESSCCFAKNEQYSAADVACGELIAFTNVGAYGFSMASHYNTRPLIAEYLLKTNGGLVQIRACDKYHAILSPEL